MKVKSFGLKNFRSYGNNFQSIELTDTGGLIGLFADNGSGKTSLSECLEYTRYGKIRGRTKQWSSLSSVQNRYNKGAYTKVIYENDIVVERTISPESIVVKKGAISYKEHDLDTLMPFDHDLYNSIVSFNSKSFMNYMSLSKHDKQLLIDRVLNLHIFDKIKKILEQLKSEKERKSLQLESSLSSYTKSMKLLQQKMLKAAERQDFKQAEELELLSKELLSKKEDFELLQKDIHDSKNSLKKLQEHMQSLQTKISSAEANVVLFKKQIKLYEQEKCPTCQSDLTQKLHTDLHTSLVQKVDKYTNAIEQAKKQQSELRTTYQKLYASDSILQQSYGALVQNVQQIKNSIDIKNQNISKPIENDLKEVLEQTRTEGMNVRNSLLEIQADVLMYEEILPFFEENGLKSDLIKQLLPVLNSSIRKSCMLLELPFEAHLDGSLGVEVSILGDSIDLDSLSEGESSYINFVCMLAFMNMCKLGRLTNVMFLDEPFESISPKGLTKILKLLREFCKEENINMFFVQQKELDASNFDRVIKIEKNIFSNIVLDRTF
jgi:DNA repair exonuclease SbcCD ATPase subunit